MKKGIIKALSYAMVFAMIFGIVNIGGVSNVNAATTSSADMQLFTQAMANTTYANRILVLNMMATKPSTAYVFKTSIVPEDIDGDIVDIINPGSEATRVVVFNALTYMKSHYSTHSLYINFALNVLAKPLDLFVGKTLETTSNGLVAQVAEKFYSYNLFLNFLMDIKGMAANSPLFYDNNNVLELSSDMNLLINVAEGMGGFSVDGRYAEYKALLQQYMADANAWSSLSQRTAFISDLKELGLCINKPATPPSGGGGGTVTPAPAPAVTNDAGTVTIKPTADGGSLVTLAVEPVALEKKITATTAGTITLDLTASKDATAVTVQIPDASFDKLVAANKTVTLQSEKAAIVLPVEVLKQLSLASANGNITINVNIVKDAPVNSNSKSVSQVIDFTITAGGNTVSNFDKPVNVSMKVDGTKVGDYRKVSAYYYNETTKVWEAIGGYMNKTTGELTFITNHFSKYAAMENNKSFSDVSTPWAKDSIEVLASRNIMSGVGGDKFAPKNNISRAEVAAMLARALNLDTKAATGKFTDVAASKWYASEVEAAANAGIIAGVDTNKFAPDAQISREQIATMIYRAMEYKQGKTDLIPNMSFTDASTISAYAKNAIAVAAHKGIVVGSDNKFMPKQNATREQVAVMIYRLLVTLGEM